jgi:hypothetical protein
MARNSLGIVNETERLLKRKRDEAQIKWEEAEIETRDRE